MNSSPPDAEVAVQSVFVQRRPGRWGLVAVLGLMVVLVVLGPSAIKLGRRALAEYYLARAAATYWQAGPDDALRWADRAMTLTPAEPAGLFQRAGYLFEAGRYQESLDDYDALLRLSPSFAEGYTGRGMVLQRLGRHGEAVQAFQEALRLFPSALPASWNNLAYARALHGEQLEEALREVEHAIQLDKEGPNPLFLDTRGFIQFKRGRYEEALADLDAAVSGMEARLAELRHATGGVSRRRETFGTPRSQRIHEVEARQLGALLHHRALVFNALGDATRASEDTARSRALGFDPHHQGE